MHRIHWLDPDQGVQFGLGFEIWKVGVTTVVGHGGGCPGYITNFLLSAKEEIGIVALTNAGDGPASRLTQNILKIIGPAVKKAKTPTNGPIPDLSIYEGDFEYRPWGGELAIRQWGNHLVAINVPSNELEKAMVRLKRDKDHTFIRLTEDKEPREPWYFELDKDGKAERIRHHHGYWKRIE